MGLRETEQAVGPPPSSSRGEGYPAQVIVDGKTYEHLLLCEGRCRAADQIANELDAPLYDAAGGRLNANGRLWDLVKFERNKVTILEQIIKSHASHLWNDVERMLKEQSSPVIDE